MSEYFNALEQKDLFENSSTAAKSPKKPSLDFLSHHKVSLRLDQLLICSIGLLCLGVFVFCMGVEKGKGFAVEELKAERVKRETVVKELGAKLFAKSKRDEQKKPEPVKAQKKEVAAPKADPIIKEEAPKRIQEPIEVPVVSSANFTIQMVTYRTEKAAHNLIKKLTAKGHKTFLIPSGKHIQVSLGAFETRQMANRALRKFKADGVVPSDAYVRSLPR